VLVHVETYVVVPVVVTEAAKLWTVLVSVNWIVIALVKGSDTVRGLTCPE
jgi:hypothetical protein